MTYGYDETIELLQRAVTEKGDGFTYQSEYGPSCLYKDYRRNHQGEAPACIVGHVLHYVGLLDQVRRDHEGVTVKDLPSAIQKSFTPPAFVALFRAQRTQDNGKTWGEALIAAKEVQP